MPKLKPGSSGLKRNQLSATHLLIFLLVFGLIGFFIYKSFAAGSGPITISQGGTYSGNWSSTDTTPVVKINTNQPVIIENSTITTTGTGKLIDANYGGADVTIRNSTLSGPASGSESALYSFGYKNIVFQNNKLTGTWGIRLDAAQQNATVSIKYNKVNNIRKIGSDLSHFFQAVNNDYTIPIEVAWNEVINNFTQTDVEDNISMYNASGAKIHDNYIQGAYPQTITGGFSGSGIMIDTAAHDNEVYNNQIVDTVNAGIGIASGWNNKVHDNRMIFDGRDDSGNLFTAANIGLFVWNYDGNANWANNDAWNNTIGWGNNSGGRNDWWLPNCSGNCSNTSFSGTLNHAAEQAEYQTWLNKLSSAGITLGPQTTTSPLPTVSLSASPTTITSGQTSTLTWTSANATSCTAGSGWSASSTSGTYSVSPISTTTYSLNCSGPGGNGSASAIINVNPATDPGWTFCANEGGQCKFSGTMTVRYGANNTYFTKTLTNGTACDNSVFGDPVVGAGKHCDYQAAAAAPGDLNNDGHVTVTDLSILLSNYSTSNTTADINKDGTVNITDLSILLSHYGS